MKRGREQLAGVVEIHRVCSLFTLTTTETSVLPPCENNFRQSVVYLNRKIDLHNLKVKQLVQAEN